MTSNDREPRPPIRWVVDAMNRAADRMIHVHWHQPDEAYSAIGETLWWLCILEDLLRQRHGRSYKKALAHEPPTGDLLTAMRYARNRFAHSADVLEFVEPTALTGSQWVGGYQVAWKWRYLPPVPSARGTRGEIEYKKTLANRDVKQSLVEALTFLRSVAHEN